MEYDVHFPNHMPLRETNHNQFVLNIGRISIEQSCCLGSNLSLDQMKMTLLHDNVEKNLKFHRKKTRDLLHHKMKEPCPSSHFPLSLSIAKSNKNRNTVHGNPDPESY